MVDGCLFAGVGTGKGNISLKKGSDRWYVKADSYSWI